MAPRELPDHESWHLDKRVPIALIVTILAQAVVGVWWTANLARDVAEDRRRIEKLELLDEGQTRMLASINESLARIDERLKLLVQRQPDGVNGILR